VIELSFAESAGAKLRISERLRTLQELVPNGTMVDLVTMLEKTIRYVKFLQLQVKVPDERMLNMRDQEGACG
jgi:hypothetical protein